MIEAGHSGAAGRAQLKCIAVRDFCPAPHYAGTARAAPMVYADSAAVKMYYIVLLSARDFSSNTRAVSPCLRVPWTRDADKTDGASRGGFVRVTAWGDFVLPPLTVPRPRETDRESAACGGLFIKKKNDWKIVWNLRLKQHK